MEAGTTVGEYDCSGKVDLLSEPKFLGRNHIVSEDGEPIDPFEIQLRDDRGDLCLQRRTAGELGLEDVSPLDRRATGRYPVALLRADAVTLEQHLAIANELAGRRAGGEEESGVGEQHLAIANELAGAPEHRSLPAYLEERIQRLREDLSPTDPDVEASTAERVRLLEQTRPGTMLWRRFFFQACYRHFVSGVVTHQKLPGAWGLKVIQSERWLVEYRLGFYDSDAMAALIWGTLRVPVRKRDA
ncbi:MAG TPA: hypothetical protein VI197_19590, partial [Polyangiaceae bacterium]